MATAVTLRNEVNILLPDAYHMQRNPGKQIQGIGRLRGTADGLFFRSCLSPYNTAIYASAPTQ